MNIYYFIGWTHDEFRLYVNKNYDLGEAEGSKAMGRTVMLLSDAGQTFIWVKKKNDLETLVHECVHAANWITDRAGYKLDHMNDEPYAYLVMNIFRQARLKSELSKLEEYKWKYEELCK